VNRLLARSPQILPIPGSGSPEHVEQNVAAAIDLEPAEIRNHQSRDNYLV
jgi:pyridoxine 4-dehydrogenase